MHLQAEEMLTSEHVELISCVNQKDRGPFLFWVLNDATEVQRADWAAILVALLGKVIYSYGLYGCGLYGYGLHSYGLHVHVQHAE